MLHGVSWCYTVLQGVTLCQDPISRPLSAAVRKDRQTTLCLCGRFCYCNLSIGLDKIDEIQMDITAATIHSKLQISTNNFLRKFKRNANLVICHLFSPSRAI